MRKLIPIILFALFASSAYSERSASGRIIIAFKEPVDGPEVIAILKKLNLQFIRIIIPKHTYFFKTKNKRNAEIKDILGKSRLFKSVEIPFDNAKREPSSDSIIAGTQLSTTKQDVEKLITTIEDIKIDFMNTNSVKVLVSVPPGQEKNQLKEIVGHKSVKYANEDRIRRIQ